MKPVSPVMPGMSIPEVVMAKDQPEYLPLPAVILDGNGSTPVFTRWRLTDEERFAISAGGDVVLSQMTFHSPLQPIHLQVCMPDEMPNCDHI